MKRFQKLILGIMVFCMISGISSFAIFASPDLSMKGTVVVTPLISGETENIVKDVELEIYQVAVITEVGGQLSYALTGEFADSNIDTMDLDKSELASDLEKYVSSKELEGNRVRADESGTLRFENLNLGIYLFIQVDTPGVNAKISSFVVTVPMFDSSTEEWIYNIDASPKMSIMEKETPESPSEPETTTPGELIYTGQLNWPIPVLTILGIALFAIGCIIFMSRRKNEKN